VAYDGDADGPFPLTVNMGGALQKDANEKKRSSVGGFFDSSSGGRRNTRRGESIGKRLNLKKVEVKE